MLLEYSTFPRAMMVFDMYTDIIVALSLYKAKESIFFMLSCLFISFPFVMVWSASLRFVQRYMDRLENSDSRANISNIRRKKGGAANEIADDENDKNKASKHGRRKNKYLGRWRMEKLSLFENIVLSLYIFPPIGIIMVTLYEIYWVLTDIVIALKCFVQGNIMIIDEESEYKSFKRYRKILEMFGESIPQTFLTLVMFYVGVPVSRTELILSFCSSVINFTYNAIRFWREAKFHGMCVL